MIYNMPTKREDLVNTPSLDYYCQINIWQMIQDLLGGTDAMRQAAERWLPKEDKELETAYNARLNRTFLYNGLGNTIARLVAKPFSKPVTRKGDLPENLQQIEDDVDKTGVPMSTFARSVFAAALEHGRAHALIDFTNMPAKATIADEKKANARPTLVLVKAPDLIGWRIEDLGNGPELTQIRIRECRREPQGNYIDKEAEYIRVFTKTTWELWEKQERSDGKEEDKFLKIKEGTHTFGAVPLVSYYINGGDFVSRCPLEDLAWINIRHWQSSSEQNSVLRVARIGILFASGFKDDEIKDGIVIGPNHCVVTESTEAKLEYVEHTGQAIKAGQDDLDKLETRMEVLGLKPLIERTSNSTMGGKLIDEMSTHTNIQSWIRVLEKFLFDCMSAAGRWMKTEVPDTVKYDVYSDFGLAAADAVHLQILLDSCIAGKISDELFLEEFKRRCVISESVKIPEELKRVEADRAKQLMLDIKLAEAGKTPEKPTPAAG